MSTTSTAILKAFADRFTTTPRLFFSPGRINLIGEHVDYNDGYVMPAAIDKGVWFAVAANNSDQANIFSHDMNEEVTISRFDVKPMDGWRNYVLGVIDQLQQKNLPISGFDCVFGGNLPIGAGLSSSAAVACGLLVALNSIFHCTLSTMDMALMAQKAEHTFPGVKCGIMDQFANLFGKLDNVILLNCKTLEHEYLPLKLNDHSLVLINTKVHHSLATGEYNLRRQQCEEGLKIIQSHFSDITSYQQVTTQQVEQLKDKMEETIYNRCSFVTGEIKRTKLAAQHLQQNNLEEFGKLMYATHEGLSKLYEVSCAELDFLVEKAKAEPAIIGSRVMGGGFGGCTINLVQRNDWAAVVNRITEAYEKQFNITPDVIEVATGDGTYEAVEG